MAYALFILVNATLFVRPAEIVPSLIGLPIYNALITCGLAASFFPVLRQLGALGGRPITFCVLGVWAMVVVSHLAGLDLWSARERGVEFGKIVLYYLLLLAVLNTPRRVRSFLAWLAGFTAILAALALLQYHGFVNIPALEALERWDEDEETGERVAVVQLCSTGIYNDPNDLCLILVVGVMISLHRLSERGAGVSRAAWAAPLALFTYALLMTKSRGGFLALLSGLGALFVSRYGWRRAVPPMLVIVPAMFLISGGRQTKISMGADTAQERMRMWSEGLHMLTRSPRWALLGIGSGTYADEMGLVAHNSYVHAFTELGLVGGAFFLGAFYLSARGLYRLGSLPADSVVPELRGLRPFLLAMVVGYATGMLSLSRCYIVPTYMLLGLVAAFFRAGVADPAAALPRVDGALLKRLAVVSVVFLVVIYTFMRINLQWG